MMRQHCCFLCLATLFILSLAEAQQDPSIAKLLLQGRFNPGVASDGFASLPQTFSWPASSAFTSFEGNSITVVLQAVPQVAETTYSVNWFRFFIDGQAVQDGFTSYNAPNLTVTLTATGPGTHTVRILKLTEGSIGEAVLQSLTLSPGGRFVTPQPAASLASGRRILIFGDSFAAGFGVGGINADACLPSADSLQPDWATVCTALKVPNLPECAKLWLNFQENGLLAFGPLAAEALHADYQLLASSGSGFVGYAFAEDTNPGMTMADLQSMHPSNQLEFNRSVFADPTSLWPLASWIPQVVVVGSGANDLRDINPDYSIDQWVQEALDFLRFISKTYNQPTIILLVYPAWRMGNVRDGFNVTVQYEQGMPQLYDAAKSVGLANVQMLQLASLGAPAYADWCDNHPSAAAHAAVAAQLSAFISTLQPGWVANGTIDLNPPFSTIRPQTTLYTSPSASSGPPPSSVVLASNIASGPPAQSQPSLSLANSTAQQVAG